MSIAGLILALFVDTREIQSLFDRLMAADNRGDVAAVAACYAEDAVFLPPGGQSVEGIESIRSKYEELFAANRLEVRMEVDAVEVKGLLAFSRGSTRGRIVPKDGSAPREIADRYLMVLRREKVGGWKIAILMWGPITGAPK